MTQALICPHCGKAIGTFITTPTAAGAPAGLWPTVTTTSVLPAYPVVVWHPPHTVPGDK